MDFLTNQARADELKAVVKARVVASSVRTVSGILRSCPTDFSLATLTYDMMKFVKSISTVEEVPREDLSELILLLTTKYALTFRPSPKKVIEIIKTVIKRSSAACVTQFLDLLHSCLRTQQGNPKNNFLTVAHDFVPVASELSPSDIDANRDAIKRALSAMFQSAANMMCVSQYLSSRPEESTAATTGKKRKSAGQSNEIYVSHLFEKMNSNFRISKLVLEEFISRKRRETTQTSTTDEASTPAPTDQIGDKDEFLFFLQLLNRASSVEAKIELWKCMSSLRIYKLRDDFGDEHKSELRKFLAESIDNSIPEELQWRALGTVLSIDPVNFTEEVLMRIWDLLKRSKQASGDMSECLAGLFRSFAVKGSLSDLVRVICEQSESSGTNLMESVDVSALFRDHSEVRSAVSAADLIDSLSFLLPQAAENDCARSLAIPLIEHGCGRLPENLLAKTAELLSGHLSEVCEKFSEAKKSKRHQLSALILAAVDGLRKVRIAWSFPQLISGASEETPVIEQSLTLVAKKDSSNRCAALVRLAVVFGVNVSVSDLIGCANADDHILTFIDGSAANARCLVFRFASDPDFSALVKKISKCVTPQNFRAFPDTVVPEGFFSSAAKRNDATEALKDSDLETLILRSGQIVSEFPRMVYTPISLRRNTFPSDIIAVESAWSNRADSETITTLVKAFTAAPSEPVMYSLSVVLEEVRRSHKQPQTIVKPEIVESVLQRISDLSLLAQTRFVLAVHGLVGLDTKLTSELLVSLSYELLINDTRDRPAVDAAYFCLFQGLVTGKDRRKIRLPWWSNKMITIIVAIRGLLGCCISATDEGAKVEAAHYVVRVWRTLIDGLSAEKFYRISKSVPTLVGEYIRLSGRITSADCASVLDRGCCAILDKLSDSEKQYLHAMLGKDDRETLKRLNELLERNYKYKGKI